jgi:hypothetical protein
MFGSSVADPGATKRGKNWCLFTKNPSTFPKKLALSSQRYGCGIRDPGVKKALNPGSGSATLVGSIAGQCWTNP